LLVSEEGWLLVSEEGWLLVSEEGWLLAWVVGASWLAEGDVEDEQAMREKARIPASTKTIQLVFFMKNTPYLFSYESLASTSKQSQRGTPFPKYCILHIR
jgi:hypothetical protein